jgi:hypothetical protein
VNSEAMLVVAVLATLAYLSVERAGRRRWQGLPKLAFRYRAPYRGTIVVASLREHAPTSLRIASLAAFALAFAGAAATATFVSAIRYESTAVLVVADSLLLGCVAIGAALALLRITLAHQVCRRALGASTMCHGSILLLAFVHVGVLRSLPNPLLAGVVLATCGLFHAASFARVVRVNA